MKGRSKREAGGRNLAAEDAKTKNMEYTKDSNVNREVYERKRGGKAMGKIDGEKATMHAGRKPRKSGGRAGSNMNPLSSAAKGSPAPGRNVSGSIDL
jgi:hypothetical protein